MPTVKHDRPEESSVSRDLQADPEAQYADAVAVLATALDRLGARIHRDVHVESSNIDLSADPRLAQTLASFSSYADECLTALDNPSVMTALATARTGRP